MSRRTLVVTIDCENDAGSEPLEQARLLEEAATRLREGCDSACLMDINGNTIGTMGYKQLQG